MRTANTPKRIYRRKTSTQLPEVVTAISEVVANVVSGQSTTSAEMEAIVAPVEPSKKPVAKKPAAKKPATPRARKIKEPIAEAEPTPAPAPEPEAISASEPQYKDILWGHVGLSAVVGGAAALSFNATGISIDTRTIEAGDVFVAVRSARDGHAFVREAAQKGAAAAIVSWRPRGVSRDFPLVFVRNTRTALEQLATAALYRNGQGVRLAVTGSVGKTSVKDMLQHVLSAQGKTHASVKSYNNDLGVALTAARLPFDTRYSVFELGMNAAGEIASLSQSVQPHVAIVTAVGAAHFAAFNSEADIASAKAEIFSGLLPNGVAIINADSEYAPQLQEAALAAGAQIMFFGVHPQASVRIIHAEANATHTDLAFMAQGQVIKGALPSIAPYAAHNVAAVLAGVLAVGADVQQALADLATWQPVEGRGVHHTVATDEGGSYTLIDDSYNANPLSVHAALQTLAHLAPAGQGRRIAILGDMAELGEHSLRLHQDVLTRAPAADIFIMAGNDFAAAAHTILPAGTVWHRADNMLQIKQLLQSVVRAGDIVLVKGSRSALTGQLIPLLLNS